MERGGSATEFTPNPVAYFPRPGTREDYVEHPLIVTIETLASCNATCDFCTYVELGRKHTRLTTEKIYEILDELKEIPVTFSLQFTGISEVFVDKRAPEFFKYAKENLPNASMIIYTNGSLLNQKNRDWIRALPLRHLSVSLNEIDPQKYRDLMGLDLQNTLDCLKALHEEFDPEKMRVDLSRVGDKGADDKAFFEFVAEHFPKFNAMCIEPFDWLSRDESGPLDNQQILALPCKQYYAARVLADGKVTLCTQDDQGEHPHGNVYEDSLLSIYRKNKFRDARMNKTPRRDLPFPCNQCNSYRQGALPFK